MTPGMADFVRGALYQTETWLVKVGGGKIWKQFREAGHVHEWRLVADPAIGLWRKRDCPGGDWECVGRAEVCICGSRRFVPADSRLRIVEVED